MPQAAVKIATYEDLFTIPEHHVGEIINGALHSHPRPAPKHALAFSSLGDELVSPYQKGKGGPGGWWILDEPECHIASHVLVPDLAGWRKESMPSLPETAWFEIVPNWVCEILSPSTARLDRAEKMPIYAQAGVKHLWLIDPELQLLECYERQENNWLLLQTYEKDQLVCALPFEKHEFNLDVLWE
ncbi:MAG: Uma2 family endonuclease [Gammaproteobacteria bacterium]|nr:Uma2 family endonuclease [Gammaproteobacteria bacterium]